MQLTTWNNYKNKQRRTFPIMHLILDIKCHTSAKNNSLIYSCDKVIPLVVCTRRLQWKMTKFIECSCKNLPSLTINCNILLSMHFFNVHISASLWQLWATWVYFILKNISIEFGTRRLCQKITTGRKFTQIKIMYLKIHFFQEL